MLAKFQITEPGYAMPLEFWVQAADLGLKIVELPVPLIYLDEARSFGGSLDNAAIRLAVYREVLHRSLAQSSCQLSVVSCRLSDPLTEDGQLTTDN